MELKLLKLTTVWCWTRSDYLWSIGFELLVALDKIFLMMSASFKPE